MVSTDTVVVVGRTVSSRQGRKFQIPAWHSLRPPQWGCLDTSLPPNEGRSLDSHSLTPIMSKVGGFFFSVVLGWSRAGIVCLATFSVLCLREQAFVRVLFLSVPIGVFMPGKSHGPRSLVGYNPWGRKESDTTERLLCVCVCNNIFSFNNIYNVFSHLKHLNI